MKIKERIDNYLCDNEYKIIIKSNQINIVNFDEIIDFSPTKISIRYQRKNVIIEGENLIISKMIEEEVLIIGTISQIRII